VSKRGRRSTMVVSQLRRRTRAPGSWHCSQPGARPAAARTHPRRQGAPAADPGASGGRSRAVSRPRRATWARLHGLPPCAGRRGAVEL